MEALMTCCCCCCCVAVLGFVVNYIQPGLLPFFGKMFTTFYGAGKFLFYYGTIFSVYFGLFALTVITVNLMLKEIVNYKSNLRKIKKNTEIDEQKKNTYFILLLILFNLTVLVISIYLSFYFNSFFLKIPLIFYVSYTLALAASFPTGELSLTRSGSLHGFFKEKVIANFIVIIGYFAAREGYVYLRQDKTLNI